MKRVIPIVIMAIALGYCDNSGNDSLLWEFLDRVEDYGDKILTFQRDFVIISGTLHDSELNYAIMLTEVARAAHDYYWHIYDLTLIYIKLRNDREIVSEIMNKSRTEIVKHLESFGERINQISTWSNHKRLIIKGNQFNAIIDEFAKVLRDFEF